MQQRHTQIHSTCYTDGKVQSTTLALTRTNSGLLPDNKGTTEVEWLDNTHKLGVVIVQYK
ncbi:hypothetical protein QNH14_13465 [Apirhabdus apintestini]|nr:hypothetical protein QNH14_13465 [Enterobacteriaceae bacterium CA-0114]